MIDINDFQKLGEIANMFAHEIKNHLASIQLTLDTMGNEFSQGQSLDIELNVKRLNRMKKGIALITASVQDFLKLSTPLEINIKHIKIEDFIHETGDFIEPECDAAGIKIEYDIEKDIGEIETDRKNLGSALLNLIINSKEAVNENGAILLSCRKKGPETVSVSVEDDGGGMKKEDEAKIFQKFFSTKDHGTGLGLMIVKKIVNTLSGKISYKNNIGKGMVFTIDLPVKYDKG